MRVVGVITILIFGQLLAVSRLFLLAFLLLLINFNASAQVSDGLSVRLSWNLPLKNEDGSCLLGTALQCSNDLAGIKLYRATVAGNGAATQPVLYASLPATATSYIDTKLSASQRYRYFVTAVDSSGNESGKRNTSDVYALSPLSDDDGDGIINARDNCPLVANLGQKDSDSDGVGDSCTKSSVPDSGEGGGDSSDGSKPDSGSSDSDADGHINRQDNCPLRFNPDQADSDGDGIGDICDRVLSRVDCSKDGSSAYSSIAILNNSKTLLIDPVSALVAVKEGISNATQFGNFNSGSDGFENFGELELAQVRSENQNALNWEIVSGDHIDSIVFGSAGDSSLGCYVDGDSDLDLAVYNKSRFLVRRSLDAQTVEASFAAFGQVRDVACADLNGDGLDELIILHVPLKEKIKKSKSSPTTAAAPLASISVIDVATQQVIKKTNTNFRAQKLAIADTTGDGKKDLCASYKLNADHAAISCKNGGKNPMQVPAFKNIVAGKFEAGKSTEGFVIQTNSNQLFIVGKKGKLKEVVSLKAGLKKQKGGGKGLRLVDCR